VVVEQAGTGPLLPARTEDQVVVALLTVQPVVMWQDLPLNQEHQIRVQQPMQVSLEGQVKTGRGLVVVVVVLAAQELTQ
jgi:hypothetical protein